MDAYDAAWEYRLGYDDGLAAGAAAERERLTEVVCGGCGEPGPFNPGATFHTCGAHLNLRVTRAEYRRLHPEGGS